MDTRVLQRAGGTPTPKINTALYSHVLSQCHHAGTLAMTVDGTVSVPDSQNRDRRILDFSTQILAFLDPDPGF